MGRSDRNQNQGESALESIHQRSLRNVDTHALEPHADMADRHWLTVAAVSHTAASLTETEVSRTPLAW